jgi:uncharacterized protein YbcI
MALGIGGLFGYHALYFAALKLAPPAEASLAAVQPPEKGRDMLKSVRTYLLETSRPRIDALVQESTDLRCVSMHHDISTITGEEVFVFTLSGEMNLRETKRRRAEG